MRRFAAALALLSGACLVSPAGAATGAKNFDHTSTGFPLTGQHETTRCEDCHVRGIFKGTPRACAACHVQGGFVVAKYFSEAHFPTTTKNGIPIDEGAIGNMALARSGLSEPCSTCHTTASFYGAHFAHSALTPGYCAVCHQTPSKYQGVSGQSKDHVKVPVTTSCDMCHTTASFATANLALPVGHIPTQQPCVTCHASSGFVPGVMNHTGTAGTCTTCHAPGVQPYTFTIKGTQVINGVSVTVTQNGNDVTVMPMSQGGLNAARPVLTGSMASRQHISTTASCDNCHTNGVFTAGSAFTSGGMQHSVVAGVSCSSCHNVSTAFFGTGAGAGGRPVELPGTAGVAGAANHIPLAGLDCATSGCHVVKNELTGTGFRTGIVPELSAAGHSAVTASLSCDACHTIGMQWFGVATLVTPGAAHIPPDTTAAGTTVDCKSCHVATSFGQGQFHIAAVPGAATATTNTSEMPPASHSAVGSLSCVTCHEAGNTSFQGVLTQIYLRPGQGAASGISKAVDASHTVGNAATQDCKQCHTVNNFTGIAKPSNHIPLNTPAPSCGDCHANGYAPGLSAMKHADVTQIACATCHYSSTTYAGSSQGANGQPWQIPGTPGTAGSANHIPLGSLGCSASGCHAASDVMNGVGFKTNIVPELSAAGHSSITATLACDACHTSGMAWFGVANLVAPGAAHIPPDNTAAGTTVDCKSCHSATSFGSAGFHLAAPPDPAGSTTNASAMPPASHTAVGSLSCASCHEAGDTSFQGVLTQIYLRPGLGAASGVSKAVDAAHTVGNAATQDCKQCHNTSNFVSFVVPGNHIPLNTPQPACADCHAAGYGPGITTMKHADVTQIACATCHNNKTTTYAGTGQGANGQPWQIPGTPGTAGAANHIPLAGLGCSASGCHAATDVMNGVGFKTNIVPELSAAGHTSVTATLACDTCHTNGMAWFGVANLVAPSAVHIPPDNTASGTTVDCKSCHSATSFGTSGFHLTAVPGAAGATTNTSEMPPSSHSAVGSLSCVSCHEAGDTSFQGVLTQIYLRPGQGAASGISKAVDVVHTQGNQASQDCGQCHSINNFSSIAKPSNHIPLNTPAPACADCHANGYGPGISTMKHADVTQIACATCHNNKTTTYAGTGQGANGQPWQIPGTPGTAGSANHIPLAGLGCSASGCHAATDVMNGVGFKTNIVPELSAAGHTSVTATLACDTCHTNGMAWFGVANLVAPSAVHIPPDNTASGTTVDCKSCHSATSFGTSGFHLTAVPGAAGATTNTSEMPPSSHSAVGSLSCATCHEAGNTGFQGVNTQIYLRPGQGAASGISKAVDVAHTQGNQASQDCVQCHSTNNFISFVVPADHIPLNTPQPSCADCHSAGYAPGLTVMKHADVTQIACATCHNNKTTTYAGTGQGANGQPVQIPGTPGTSGSANHIPLAGLGCSASGCHAATDVMNGVGFKTNIVPELSAAGHTSVTATLACDTCHTNGMAWFGVANLVAPSAAHIPPDNTASGTTVDCKSCHSATSFGTSGFHLTAVPGAAGATTNTSEMPPASHTAVGSLTCVSCHEAGDTSFQGVLTQIYLRPGQGAASGISKAVDVAHTTGNPATQDCVQCHSINNFSSIAKPSNHIPLNTPAPACADCHANGYGSGITTMKHADVTQIACATCHYTTTVYAGSSQGANGQPWQIPGTPGTSGAANHIPLGGLGCSASGCHAATDVMNGVGFKTNVTPVLSAAGHTSVTASVSCQTCHNIGLAWYGAPGLVTPAVNSGTPAGTHIPPYNAAGATENCKDCHVATSFGTGGFKLTGTPGTITGGTGTTTNVSVMSISAHSAVSSVISTCDTCHQQGLTTWLGVGSSIFLRPDQGAASGLSNGADTAHASTGAASGNPGTSDCSGCHSSTSFAGGTPANHIPIVAGATCTNCHVGGTSNNVTPTAMPHTGYVSGTCASCHNSSTVFAGPVFTPATTGAGGTFGTYTAGQVGFRPRQIVSSPAVGTSGGHIPLVVSGEDCSVCHSSTSAFGPGTPMGAAQHAGITSGCATCHAAGSKWYGETYTASPLVTTGNVTLSPLHVPINQGGNPACEECHSNSVFTSFGTSTKVNHTSGGFMTYSGNGTEKNPNRTITRSPNCTSCHAPKTASWYPAGTKMSAETIPGHETSQTGDDCIFCHSTSGFNGAAAAAAAVAHRPIQRTAGAPVRPSVPGLPSLPGTPFNHLGVVPGGCVSCHGLGGTASVQPANHLPTTLSCDACHRTSAWLPALFNHNGVLPGTCSSCHAAGWATAKPANHMLTSRTCDTCHHSTTSWTPEAYTHMDLVYSPHPTTVACTACHASNTEQVVWKYPSFKPGCAGCHGTQFNGTAVRRSAGPAVPRPRGTP